MYEDDGLFTIPAAGDTADLSAAIDSPAREIELPELDYAMPDRMYNILKWIGLILCPALATLISTIGPSWGLPHVDSIVLTINAIGLFIGTCIGASQVSAMGKVNRDWE